MDDDAVDVCIVGSGAGGAVAAHFLSRQGYSVLVLEEGGRVGPGDSLKRLEKMWQPALRPHPDGGLTNSGRPWTAQALGGGTTLFGGIMFRYRIVDFDAGKHMSSDALDPGWPISYRDLHPYYEAVERLVGVARADHADPMDPGSGPAVMPPHPYSVQGALLDRAGRSLGLRPFPTPLAINSVPYRGRPPCHRCGPCNEHACPTGARMDLAAMLLDPLVADGSLAVRPFSRALRINLARCGVAGSVEWLDLRRHARRTTRARAVVVAANAVQSAALLLRSTGRGAPAGLGNGHDMVGRGLSFKVSGYRWGSVPAPGPGPEDGPFSSVAFSDHYLDPRIPSGLGGIIYEANPERDRVRDGRLTLRLHFLAGDQPRARNRVRLSAGQDAFGVPRVVMDYVTHPIDESRRDHLAARAVDLLRAAGVTAVHAEPSNYHLGSRHLHGGCRAGQDPQTSVVDRDGRVHEAENVYVVDGGFFPFAGGVNPTLTIQANSLRIAERIAAHLGTAAPRTTTRPEGEVHR
ncbi:FAD-dependent oxidoreductase [Micromonospora sp. SH-82]|uniref:FAD-dependent oxidoreductase n=1 Tax=Micromonospora sp. SH-82 TaxID=3132938 RepID=UPI003EBCA2D7